MRWYDSVPKRKLYTAALHLAALATGRYDAALENGEAEQRLDAEIKTLAEQGIEP